MRLVHKTFLVLALVVLVAVGSMGGLFALTLESGFIAYVNARQQEQFDAFHRLLLARIEQDGSIEPLMRNEFMWRRMMRQAEGEGDAGPPLIDEGRDGREGGYRRRRGEAPGAPAASVASVASVDRAPSDADDRPPPSGRVDDRPLPRGGIDDRSPRPPSRVDDRPPPPAGRIDDRPPPPPGRADDRPPPPPPQRLPGSDDDVAKGSAPKKGGRGGAPPANNPYGLGQSIVLLAADRTPVYRTPRAATRNGSPVERVVKLGDQVQGYIQLWPIDRIERPEDLAFLRTQYRQLAWGTGVLVLLMLALAPLIARRVTRPLREVTAATESIARGKLDVRLPTTRTDEIGALMVNVNAMADSLQRLEQTRRRWIAEIAHELRTPLTVLQAELEALAVGVRPLEPQAIVSLQDETRQLTRLVADLHQLALADLDALPCTMAPVDLGALLRRVIERFAAQAADKGLRLELDAGAVPMRLEADAQRLEQLVSNLLSNSIRYTDAPGRVVLRAAASRESIAITVDDTPPGVAAADYQRLFDPLYRADKARSRTSGGSGLGLAIARAIVLAHGGTITASPSPLGGLRISVTLPG